MTLHEASSLSSQTPGSETPGTWSGAPAALFEGNEDKWGPRAQGWRLPTPALAGAKTRTQRGYPHLGGHCPLTTANSSGKTLCKLSPLPPMYPSSTPRATARTQWPLDVVSTCVPRHPPSHTSPSSLYTGGEHPPRWICHSSLDSCSWSLGGRGGCQDPGVNGSRVRRWQGVQSSARTGQHRPREATVPSWPLLPEGEAAAVPVATLLLCLKPPHRCWGRGRGGAHSLGHQETWALGPQTDSSPPPGPQGPRNHPPSQSALGGSHAGHGVRPRAQQGLSQGPVDTEGMRGDKAPPR